MFVVRTSLHNSSIHGIGVFADEPIGKGQVVWQFDPRLDIAIPVEAGQEFPPAVQEYLKRLTYIEVIDGRKMMILCADNGKHVNHSDNPNLLDTPDGKQQYAARDIAVGEELTCNYFAPYLQRRIAAMKKEVRQKQKVAVA